jgi:hypothetical protein
MQCRHFISKLSSGIIYSIYQAIMSSVEKEQAANACN